MKYIYEITINLNKRYIEFFDWNKNDNLIYLKKCPILKVSTKTVYDLISNDVIISDVKTFYNYKNTHKLCIFTDENICVCIDLFSNTKSSLEIEDLDDIIEISDELEEANINYKIIKKNNYIFKTRKELEKEKYIKKNIKYLENNIDKLKYIYFDIFNSDEIDKTLMLNKIKQNINDIKILNKLYDFFKLTSVK